MPDLEQVFTEVNDASYVQRIAEVLEQLQKSNAMTKTWGLHTAIAYSQDPMLMAFSNSVALLVKIVSANVFEAGRLYGRAELMEEIGWTKTE